MTPIPRLRPGRGKSMNLTKSIRIVRLENASFAIPVLKQWFIEEWAPWYGSDGKGNA